MEKIHMVILIISRETGEARTSGLPNGLTKEELEQVRQHIKRIVAGETADTLTLRGEVYTFVSVE